MCIYLCARMLSHFSCVWLCDPMNCSLPGSSVHGILQARILERNAMPSSRGSSPPRDWTQVSCRQILYHLSHQGSSRILEWVAYSFSRGSFWPRNWTKFSCIASRFFTSWATREVQWLGLRVFTAEGLGSSPGLGRSPGEGNGIPLQYYCLENPMDRGAW